MATGGKSARKRGRTRKPTRTRTVDDACGSSAEDYAHDPGAESFSPAALPSQASDREAVRVEVRPGEVVITIRTDAWNTDAMQTISVPVGVRAEQDAAQAEAQHVGLIKVPADKVGDGYGNAWIRADLRDEYLSVLQKVKALGGILTSSGAIRELSAGVSPGRSRTSFHYTGRAIDLYIYTGMQGANDRYLVQRDGGTQANPEWKVLCVSQNPLTSDPHYDASMIRTGEVEYAVWKKNVGLTAKRRSVQYFSLTDVLHQFGWIRIPARSDWVSNYTSLEWWHFQHHKGLSEGVSKFGDQLRCVWPADKVAASGLALNAVFKGRSFRV